MGCHQNTHRNSLAYSYSHTCAIDFFFPVQTFATFSFSCINFLFLFCTFHSAISFSLEICTLISIMPCELYSICFRLIFLALDFFFLLQIQFGLECEMLVVPFTNAICIFKHLLNRFLFTLLSSKTPRIRNQTI